MSTVLTDAEKRVLLWLADGLGNKDIALKTGTSEHTVKFHITNIMTKIDQHTRTGVVIKALKLGLIALWDVMTDVPMDIVVDSSKLTQEEVDKILANAPPKPHYDIP